MEESTHKYRLYFYKTNSGKEIVIDFIESLDTILKARVRNGLRLLEEHGLMLLQNLTVKNIYRSPSLYELRVIGKQHVRIVFVQYNENTFLIVHAFLKKTQKTPQRELDTAIQRAKEFV